MLNQRDSEYSIEKGLSCQDSRKHDKALLKFSRAVRKNPSNGQAYYNFGNAYFLQGKFKQAKNNYLLLTCISPKDEQAYYNLGVTLFEQTKYEDAIKQYNKAAEINPYTTPAYSNWGYTLYFLGRYEEAYDILKKAIALRDGRILPYLNCGLALFHQRKFSEAIEMLREGIKIGMRNIRDFKNTINFYMNEIKRAEEESELILIDRKQKDHLETKVRAIKLLFGLIQHDYPDKYDKLNIYYEISLIFVQTYLKGASDAQFENYLCFQDPSLKEYYNFLIQGLQAIFSKLFVADHSERVHIFNLIHCLMSALTSFNFQLNTKNEESGNFKSYFTSIGEIRQIVITLAERMTTLRKHYIIRDHDKIFEAKNVTEIEQIQTIMNVNSIKTKVHEYALVDIGLLVVICFFEGFEILEFSGNNDQTSDITETIILKIENCISEVPMP